MISHPVLVCSPVLVEALPLKVRVSFFEVSLAFVDLVGSYRWKGDPPSLDADWDYREVSPETMSQGVRLS